MPSPQAVETFLKIANGEFPKAQEGQDLLEFALLIALIALVAVGAVATVGQTIYTVFWQSIATNF
jgi:Flp pilus assembly pilin Flp